MGYSADHQKEAVKVIYYYGSTARQCLPYLRTLKDTTRDVDFKTAIENEIDRIEDR